MLEVFCQQGKGPFVSRASAGTQCSLLCQEVLLEEMVEQALWDERSLEHLMPKWAICAEALEWHVGIFDKAFEARTMSLASFHCMSPALYHHIWSQNIAEARSAHDLALAHWRCLLDAEGALAGGADMECLSNIFWRLSPFVRCLFWPLSKMMP